jgi:hypothetical protein
MILLKDILELHRLSVKKYGSANGVRYMTNTGRCNGLEI